MAKKTIDIILWEEGFYPFSLKYDLTKAIDKYKDEIYTSDMDLTSISVIKYSSYFNAYFKDICKELNKVIKKSLMNKSLLSELIIADLNRTNLILIEETKKYHLSKNSFDRNMLSNVYIQKEEFQNNSESAWAIIDGAIDTAALNLDYLEYVKFSDSTIINELQQVDVVKYLSIIGSTYNAIKQSYDRIIWNGYIISDENSVVKLNPNPRHLMLENAAMTRLTNNIAYTYDEFTYMPEKHKETLNYYHKTRTFQIIKTIEENSGQFILKYKPKTSEPVDSFKALVAPLITFYPFYKSEKIEKLGNLTILDLVNLFSILHDLVSALPIPEYNDTGIMDLSKFLKFNPKIKKETLIQHLKKTSKYSNTQILKFLDLLLQKGKKCNLYRYPLFENDEYYYFSIPNIMRSNILYMVDRWLEEGGCDLSERGYKFEDYIKYFIKTQELNQFAKFRLIEQSEFFFLDTNGKRVEEEIDLVLVTASTVIIAEIKCILYPLEPKDHYNAFQIIKKAKKQVIRKAQFLEDNWSKFEDILGKREDKTIKKIILLNFPHYSGREIENIPICDFYLFLSYFKAGQLTRAKIEKGKPIIYNNIIYYNSVEEFENNFHSFFQNPIPIEDLLSRQSIEEFEVTFKGTEPKTTSLRVVYKPITDY